MPGYRAGSSRQSLPRADALADRTRTLGECVRIAAGEGSTRPDGSSRRPEHAPAARRRGRTADQPDHRSFAAGDRAAPARGRPGQYPRPVPRQLRPGRAGRGYSGRAVRGDPRCLACRADHLPRQAGPPGQQSGHRPPPEPRGGSRTGATVRRRGAGSRGHLRGPARKPGRLHANGLEAAGRAEHGDRHRARTGRPGPRPV